MKLLPCHRAPPLPPAHTLLRLQLLFYVIWGHTMVAWAFWFAACWGRAAPATMLAIATLVFSGLVANLLVAQVGAGWGAADAGRDGGGLLLDWRCGFGRWGP